MSANSGPGYKQHPEHRITTAPAGARVQVRFKGEVIADTADAIQMQELMKGSTVAPVVYYFPRKDVKMERLSRTAHQTYCPFKGHASYYSLKDGPENAVWTYEQPYDEMSAIKELIAFYPDKVDSIKKEPSVITRINQFEAKKDFEAKLFDFLSSVISVVEKSPGCMSCRLLRSTDNPAQFAIIEEWESIDAHQSAAKAIPPERLNEAMAMFARPPSGTYYKD
jgi:uncharacterized protein (DUF427 family)/heme-degrading monooxygenase HmoA